MPPIGDYNSNPDLNTSQLGMATGNNALNVGNVDNALRKIMADLAAWYATAQPQIAAVPGKQASSTILSALVGAGAAGDRLPYYTASDAASLSPLTAFARTILSGADATAVCNQLGAVRVAAISLANPGYVKFQIGAAPLYFQVAFGSVTFPAGSQSFTYAAAFPSASFAVVSAAAVVASANNPGVTATTAAGFTTYSGLPGSIGGFYIAVGY